MKKVKKAKRKFFRLIILGEQRYCDKFDLSDRIYLGPTSADLYLAFLMVKMKF